MLKRNDYRALVLSAALGLWAAPYAFGGYTLNTLATFNNTNGANPVAGLTLSGSTLYGTTYGGGANGDGTVFSVPLAGGSPTTLATFNYTNGAFPEAGLTLSGSILYGTTEAGGAYDDGTVFSLTPVPEPASLSLLAGGMILLGRRARRRASVSLEGERLKGLRCWKS